MEVLLHGIIATSHRGILLLRSTIEARKRDMIYSIYLIDDKIPFPSLVRIKGRRSDDNTIASRMPE